MKKIEAENLVNATFTQSYDEGRFRRFIDNLFHEYERLGDGASAGRYIPESFKDRVVSYKRLAKFEDPEGMEIDVLAVKLASRHTLENARTTQRNFIARYLNGSRGGALKDAALVAFYADDSDEWRFSLVRMDYVLDEEQQKVRKELTPARRFSFLVGQSENTHTARQQLLPVLRSDVETTLAELEKAFNIESVTKEFFERYKALYLRLKEALEIHLDADPVTRSDFETKAVVIADFAKRLLGQIVFLYFLQKKGWLGVEKGGDWGSGPKDFLQALHRSEYGNYDNFFNDMLEPLFYEALATERTDNFYQRFNCRIPFLNGGLFEPLQGYDWVNTDILLDNRIFTEIFEVFDLYNFTVREDEPLDREVAVDPEMLGKVFENLIPENERKGSGTYYTPREIVHYMCQESLINYLDSKLNIEQHQAEDKTVQPSLLPNMGEADLLTKYEDVYVEHVPRDDLAEFIYHGDLAQEHDATTRTKNKETSTYSFKIPETIRKNAEAIDDALAHVKICDPAIGSGAFPVGIMNEIVRARQMLNAYLGNEGRTPYDFKRNAIQESIYGVDIEPSAVDIAKLRLWLSLVVDEEDFSNIKPLPNLDYKIVVGNSLVGFPFTTEGRAQKLRELTPLKEAFFNTSYPSRKAVLRKQISAIINSEYNDPSTEQTLGFKVDFDFRWSFFEVFDQNGGFDIIIANPPYVGESGNKDMFRKVSKGTALARFYLGKMDYFYFFFHLALDLSNQCGQIAFITTNYFVTATGAAKLRSDLKQRSKIRKLINFNELKIFETAKGQHNVISILSKFRESPFLTETAFTSLQGEASSTQLNNILYAKCQDTAYCKMDSEQVFEGQKNYIRFQIGNHDNPLLVLLDRIRDRFEKLSDICDINQGVVSGCDYISGRNIKKLPSADGIENKDGIFVFDLNNPRDVDIINSFNKEEKNLLRPFFKNSDIGHFISSDKETKKLIYISSKKHNIEDYPNIKAHLSIYREILDDRREVRNGRIKWYDLQWARDEHLFLGNKIVVPYRSMENTFAINGIEWFCRSDVYLIKSKKIPSTLKTICGILNSKLIFLWLYHKGKKKGEVLELMPESLGDIPLSYNEGQLTDEVNKIVDLLLTKIPELGIDNPTIKSLRKKIDQLVYQLYDLTSEEIAIIEEAAQ